MGNDHDPLAEFRRERWQKNNMDERKEPLTEHQALKLAISALNEVPNSRVRMEGYATTYDLIPDLEKAYQGGESRTKLAEATPNQPMTGAEIEVAVKHDIQLWRDAYQDVNPKQETEAIQQKEVNRKIAVLFPTILDTLDLCEDALTDLGRMDDGTPSIQALINIQTIKKELASPAQPGVDKNPLIAKDSSLTADLSERSMEQEKGFEPER